MSELRQHRLRSRCCRLQQPKQARPEAESSGPEKWRERFIFWDSQRRSSVTITIIYVMSCVLLQRTMLSLASSKIAIISFGNAQISVRGIPLDLHPVNYLKEKRSTETGWVKEVT